MTTKKIAARTLWNAGSYLEQRPRTPAEVLSLSEAIVIIAQLYNSVLRKEDRHVPR